MKLKKTITLNNFILLFFFIGMYAYMPSSRPQDKYIWVCGFILLVMKSIINVFIEKKHFKLTVAFKWALIFLLFIILSVFWSHDTSYLIDEYLIYIYPVIIVSSFCITSFIDEKEDIDKLFYIIIVASIIAAIRFIIYTPWNMLTINGGFLRGIFGFNLDYGKTNYNNYTSHLCISAIISSYYLFAKNKKWCWIPFIFLTIVLIFGGSRKNLFVIPVVSIIFLFMNSQNIKVKFFKFLLLSAVLVASIYLILELPLLSNVKQATLLMLEGIFNENNNIDNSTIERLYLLDAAKDVWGRNPLFGVGFNNFKYYNSLDLYSHNCYYELLSTLGIFGFVLYYSIYLYVLFGSLKRFVKTRNSIYLFAIGVIVGFMIQEIGSITFYSRERFILLLICIFSYDYSCGNYYKFGFDHYEQFCILKN